jgi:hypothetical protein
MTNDPWAGITNLGALDQKLYQQPPPEPASPSPAPVKHEDTAKPKLRKKAVTIEPAPVKKAEPALPKSPARPYERRTFDFFQDQIAYLKLTSLQEKLAGNDVGMNEMIREAVDDWIHKRKSHK